MFSRALILWLLPSLGLAYNPSVPEILSRMETSLRNSDPLPVKIVREKPDGSVLQERLLSIPAESQEDTASDPDFTLPFSLLTLPKEKVLENFKSLSVENASVTLSRYGGSICYLLEGSAERLWLRKADLVPLKAESLSAAGEWTTYLYIDLTGLSEDVIYPARTEVQRNGNVLIIERIVPARAATDQP